MSFSSVSNVIILFILLFSFNIVFAKDILINEIAWMGTEISSNDEWIELYNISNEDIPLENYKLFIGEKEIKLKGIIKANSFYVLERTDESTLPNIKADLIYTGSIKNTGAKIILKDNKNNVIDEADFTNGWTAGDNKTKQTAERIDDLWQTSIKKGGSPNEINIKAETKKEEKNSSVKEMQASLFEEITKDEQFPLGTMIGISFISATAIVFVRKQLS
ncbi:MAG: lamin tail domain-containing protein [Candidatus Pacebacteria bacterium]|nr:lamin tail domain-containing protein [Candidatus Paceibacterota bacterium]